MSNETAGILVIVLAVNLITFIRVALDDKLSTALIGYCMMSAIGLLIGKAIVFGLKLILSTW